MFFAYAASMSIYFKEKASGSSKNPTNIPLSHSIFLLTIVTITTEIRDMNRLQSINKL
jgi:hypothetical protein